MAAEPDSSMLWIRYVAYLLSTGDIAAARGVAERALQTINYRHVLSEVSWAFITAGAGLSRDMRWRCCSCVCIGSISIVIQANRCASVAVHKSVG